MYKSLVMSLKLKIEIVRKSALFILLVSNDVCNVENYVLPSLFYNIKLSLKHVVCL